MILYDMRQLEWDVNGEKTIATGGAQLKTYDRANKIYFKSSAYDPRLQKEVGYESFYEVFASRLGRYLGFCVLNYNIVKACANVSGHETQLYLTMSNDFKKPGDRKIALCNYYDIFATRKESISMFIRRIGFKKYIDQMMVFDYLIYNRDRHGRNIEIIDNKGKISLAPFFDHGNSFFSLLGKEIKYIKDFDITSDNAVNNYIGSLHLKQNLDMIDNPVYVNKINDFILSQLMMDFHGELPEEVINKMKQQVLYRYDYLIKAGKIIAV